MSVGERIRKAIERCNLPTLSRKSRITLSIGITSCGTEDDAREMLERAEDALTSAVRDGGNRCVLIDSAKQRPACDNEPIHTA